MSLIVHLSHLPTSCGTQLVLELPTLRASPCIVYLKRQHLLLALAGHLAHLLGWFPKPELGERPGILAVTRCLLKLARKRQSPGFLSLPGLGFAPPFMGHPTDRGNFYPYLGGHTKNLTIKTGLS